MSMEYCRYGNRPMKQLLQCHVLHHESQTRSLDTQLMPPRQNTIELINYFQQTIVRIPVVFWVVTFCCWMGFFETSQNSHPTFIWNISPFVLKGSRSIKYDLKAFKKNVQVFFETSESDYPVMERHIPQEEEFPTTPLRKPQKFANIYFLYHLRSIWSHETGQNTPYFMQHEYSLLY
jgi:hypothetical protein